MIVWTEKIKKTNLAKPKSAIFNTELPSDVERSRFCHIVTASELSQKWWTTEHNGYGAYTWTKLLLRTSNLFFLLSLKYIKCKLSKLENLLDIAASFILWIIVFHSGEEHSIAKGSYMDIWNTGEKFWAHTSSQ